MEPAAPPGRREGLRGLPAWLPADASQRRTLGLAALAIVLTALAYGPFLAYRPITNVSLGVEGWFFEPSDKSPPLVLALVAWLVYRRRRRLARLPAQPGAWPLTAALFAVSLSLFVWGVRCRAPDVLGISLFFQLLAVSHWLGGRPALRVLALPAFVVLFALPIPAPLLNLVVWKLQVGTAEWTGMLLHAIGLPALVSGERIIRADKVFQIIESCSGLRSIETLSMLSVLMVDLFGRHRVHAVLLMLAAVPVAFFINGLRAFSLILVPGSQIETIHMAQGIAMLLGGVLLLYLFDGLLERVLPARARTLPRRPPLAGSERRDPSARLAGIAALSCALLALGLLLPPWRLAPLKLPLPVNEIGFTLGGWQGKDVETDWLFYGMMGYRQAIHRRYTLGRDQVELFVATGARERRSRSLLSPKTALPGTGWMVEDSGRDAESAHEWRVVRQGSYRRRLVEHWTAGLGSVAAETLRTLLALDDSPLRRDSAPVVVRIATPLGRGPEARRAAERRLSAFASVLQKPLEALEAPARDGSSADARG